MCTACQRQGQRSPGSPVTSTSTTEERRDPPASPSATLRFIHWLYPGCASCSLSAKRALSWSCMRYRSINFQLYPGSKFFFCLRFFSRRPSAARRTRPSIHILSYKLRTWRGVQSSCCWSERAGSTRTCESGFRLCRKTRGWISQQRDVILGGWVVPNRVVARRRRVPGRGR